jgi:copper(I)-binding protein
MAGYMELRNDSGQLRELVAVTAEGFASTMVHRTEYGEGRASMVHVDKLEIPPNSRVTFEPGGLHIMLMQPQRRLIAGDVVTIRLQFDDGTALDVAFPVSKAQEMDNTGGHGQG